MVKSFTELRRPKISEVGGKGYSLTVLISNGFNVSKGFVIISDAFFEYLKHSYLMEKIEKLALTIDENNFKERSKEIKDLILGGKIPEDLGTKIKNHLDSLNAQYVSIRSSSVSEDSLKASFAGLHDTFLNVGSDPDFVLECIKKCWASLFNERAVIYRIKKEIPRLESMAVVVQEMIPAEVSGITFTVHPLNKRALLIEASYGLGDLIVSGKIQPDNFIVDRETLEVIEKRLGNKNRMSICKGEGTEVVEIKKELIEKQVITDEKIKETAKVCLDMEKIFGPPQDIEWCIYNNKIWLLQSRAITRN